MESNRTGYDESRDASQGGRYRNHWQGRRRIARNNRGFGKSFVGFPKEKLTNAAVAAFHEYGTKGFSLGRSGATAGGAPERSFIRATIDEKHSDIDRLFQRVAKGAVGGKVKIEKGIGLAGVKVVAWVKAKIRKGISPELMPATIRARKYQFGKASSKPLIATGQLIGSITHVVRKPSEGAK